MSRDAYELLALGARYVFAGLMVLIALRAARLTAVDSRRAAKLRRLSPMTGLSGELVVLEGDGKAPRGMRYPVIREGMIGSARSCDVRIRHASVRRRHACFQLTEQGLSVRDHAGARLRDGDGEVVREMTLLDGDSFWVGRIHLLLVLSNATAAQSRRAPEDLFATRREEDWDGEGRETRSGRAAYDGKGWDTHGEETAYDDEDWEARAETRDFARAEARSRDGFDEEDWGDPAPRAAIYDSTFDGKDGRADSALRTGVRRTAKREGDAPCSRDRSLRGASGDFDRAFSAHSDLRNRAPRGEASPLPGIARDSAPRGEGQRSVEPSVSREDRRSHASAPRGEGQRPVEPSISREDRRPHASAPRGGMKRSSQPHVREGVRREPEPPDDLFMDDL